MNRFFTFLFGAFLFFSLNANAQVEICNNLKDDTGNGLVDCADPACQFAANVEAGCNCFDGIDNDGDGKIDANDPKCASYFGIEFIGEGSDCSLVPPNLGNPFNNIGDVPSISQQNTVDTQSKMAIGDVNGDGVPDIVATSKWNQRIRVFNSNNATVMSSWSTPGSKLFPSNDSKHYVELEVAIADIDGDGIGEMYTIASYRDKPGDAATRYYLLGFRYAVKDLIPLFNAVDLGTERPGTLALTDFDGDGRAEIYIRNRIYAAESGVLLANGGGNWLTEINGASVAVDIDKGTPNQELVVGDIIYQVPNLSTRTLQTLQVWKRLSDLAPNLYFNKVAVLTAEYGDATFSSTSVADIDEDGTIDVVITGALGSNSGKTTVFYWNVAKNFVKHFPVPDTTIAAGGGGANGWPWGTSRVNIGDIDGDGQLELTFIAGNRLWALDVAANGDLVKAWPFPGYRVINDSQSGIVANTVYDFDNDGNPEIVYRDSQELVIIDGKTGQNKLKSWTCQSHTLTEGPIIADVNGDGGTDICVPCNTSNSFNINAPIQQQALGGIRLFYSSTNSWLPTRKVWNQPGYFVLHINENLTIPRRQMDMNTVFGTAPCPNGVPGPQQPFNVFLNQVPTLGPNGCPVFPAPDLSFAGDDPNDPDVDPNSPDYFPAVSITPPTCGDLGITAGFNIINDGSLAITANVPVTFYQVDPTQPGVTSADILHQVTLPLTSLQVGDIQSFGPYPFNGPGTTFTLYVVLNDDGTQLPVDLTRSSNECELANNIFSILIDPQPFDVAIEVVQNNNKCTDAAADVGELRAVITKNGVVVNDYSNYAFQWYVGDDTSTPIAAPAGTSDRLLGASDLTNYTLVVTNTLKGCASNPITGAVIRETPQVEVKFNVLNNQTQCSPFDGKLEAYLEDVNGNPVDPTGYTFTWYRTIGFVPLGIVGLIADNLEALSYTVTAEKDGCVFQGTESVEPPTLPTVNASLINSVIDCASPASGKITASASINGVVQDSILYDFEWYFWDTVEEEVGSLISATNKNPTRANVAIGFYAVIAIDKSTQCPSVPIPVEVTDDRIYPFIDLVELAPQTACDPSVPNGQIQVLIYSDDAKTQRVSTQDYTIEWFKGDNTVTPYTGTTVGDSIANQIEGGGIFYTVKVSNANNCFVTANIIVDEVKIFPVITGGTTPNSICDASLANAGAYSGTITVSSTFDGVSINNFNDYTLTIFKGTVADVSDSLITPARSISGANVTYSSLDGGYYTVKIERNGLGCSDFATFQILNTIALPIVDLQVSPQTTCSGTPNGSITAQVLVGGVPLADVSGYSFAWFQGVDNTGTNLNLSTANINQLAGGNTYAVLVTNLSTGCQTIASSTLADVSAIPTLVLTTTDNTVCDPSKTDPSISFNGSITATINPNPNALVGDFYSYRLYRNSAPAVVIDEILNTANTTVSFTGKDGDDYFVTVRNERLGCISNNSPIEINTVPLPLAATISTTPQTTCDDAIANGTATVTPSGSTGPFKYEWYEGNTAGAEGADFASTITASNLLGGAGKLYTVRITDLSSGCQVTATSALNNVSTPPVVSLTKVDNSICDPNKTSGGITFNGAINVVVTGDINATVGNTYTYRLFLASDTNTELASNATGIFTQLNGDSYVVTVTNDQLACTTNFLPINVNTVPAELTASIVATPETTCDGAANSNGSVEVTATGGIGPFAYEWFNGNTAGADGTGFTTTALAEDLAGGAGINYTVRITDLGSGCQITATSVLNNISAPPVVSLTKVDNTICNPTLAAAGINFNGTITATITDDTNAEATDTYTYQLFLASNTNDAIQINTTGLFTALDGDSYVVTVTNDQLGCTTNFLPITVNTVPSALSTTLTANAETTCIDAATPNGSIQSVVTGGVGPFGYEWFSGNLASGAVIGTDALLNEVDGGAGIQYTVRITDLGSGCQITATSNLNNISAPPVISVAKIDNTVCDPSLTDPFANFNGEIMVTITTDANGDKDNDPYTYQLFLASDPSSAIEQNSTGVFSNRGPETYLVSATNDLLGCTSPQLQIEIITIPAGLSASIETSPETTCSDATTPNGRLEVSNIQNANPANLHYQWYTGNSALAGNETGTNSPILDNQEGGPGNTYTVVITDQSSGCQFTTTSNLNNASAVPVLTLSATQNTICDDTFNPYDGSITVNYSFANNAVSDQYEITLFENDGTTVIDTQSETGVATPILFTELNGGTYFVQVVNTGLSCSSSKQQINVVNNLTLPIIDVAVTPQTACVGFNGSLEATVDVAGTPTTIGYTFNWTDANGNPVSSTDGLASALEGNLSYTVEVINQATGCSNTFGVFLPEVITNPEVEVLATDIDGCQLTDLGFLVPTVSINGTSIAAGDYADYEFIWYRGQDDSGTVISTTDGATDNGNGPGALEAVAISDYYTVKAVHKTNFCESNTTYDFVAAPLNPLFDIIVDILPPLPSSCGDPDGRMEVSIEISSVLQDPNDFEYEWFVGGPTNLGSIPTPNFYTDPSIQFGNPVGVTTPLIENILSGNYTVVVTNKTSSCKEYRTVYLPFVGASIVLNAAVQHNTQCLAPFNGEIFGQIDPASIPFGFFETDYDVYLFSGSNVDVDNDTPLFIELGNAAGHTFSNLAPGSYTFTSKQKFNDLCFGEPEILLIEDHAKDPIIFVNKILPNQSCDNPGTGSFEFKILRDPLDQVAGVTYDVTLTQTAGNATVGLAGPFLAINDNVAQAVANLNDGTYLLEVTSSNGCTQSRTVIINRSPVQPTLDASAISITPDDNCDDTNPAGSILVTISDIGSSDGNAANIAADESGYHFAWSVGETFATSTSIYDADGIAGDNSGGQFLDASKSTDFIGSGTYWVVITNLATGASPGAQCSSVPYKIVIPETSINPSLTLTPSANTACDIVFYDGMITAVALTDGIISAGGYSFILMPGSVPPSSQVGNVATFEDLAPGVYTVEVTDLATQCIYTTSTEILDQPQSPTDLALDIDITDVADCTDSGAIAVNFITPLEADEYEIYWYTSAAAANAHPAGFLLQGAANDPTFNTLSGQAAGTYYFVLEKIAGTGVGCFSAVYNATINDISVDPSLLLIPISNTNCDAPFDGRIKALASTGGVHAAGGYTYLLNPGNLPPDLFDGDTVFFTGLQGNITYTIQVIDNATDCSFIASTTVQDQPIAPANLDIIINVTDIEDCRPSGAITIVFGPASDENEFEIAWYSTANDAENQTGALKIGPANDPNNLFIDNQAEGTYYFVFRKTAGVGTGCYSAAYNATITDISEDPTLTITTTANTACDITAYDGRIEAVALSKGVSSPGGYDYTLLGTPDITNATGIFTDQAPGTYTIRVRDLDTDCTFEATATVQDQPIAPANLDIAINVTDIEDCRPSGAIEIVFGAGTDPAEFEITWYTTEADAIVGTNPILGIGGVATDVSNLNLTNQAQGTYYFVFQKIAGVGTGCFSASYNATIRDISLDPSLTITTSANTACDITLADGRIEAVAITQGKTNILGFEYTLVGTPILPNTTGIFTSLTPATYTIRVRDLDTDCTFETTATIQDQPIAPADLNIAVNVVDVTDCTPSGSISIAFAGTTLPAEFEIAWYGSEEDAENQVNTIGGGPASVLANRSILNQNAGTYYFVFKKTSGIGAGCFSAVYNATILDKSVNPALSLSATANNSCDDTQVNGSVTAIVTHGGSGNYTFTLSKDGTEVDNQPNIASFTFDNLEPGIYLVEVLDLGTQCIGSSTIVVEDKPQSPANINISVTANNQLDCLPSGSIEVVFNAAGEENNFEIFWYATSADAENDENRIVGIGGNASDPFNLSLTNQDAGTYYFTLRKVSGAGAGCFTAPYNATIQNLSSVPQFDFTLTPNTICGGSQPDGTITIIPSERDGTVDLTEYAYVWAYTGSRDSLFINPGNSRFLTGGPEGTYTITVSNTRTGCSFTSEIVMILDENASAPNIIEVTVTDPIDCNGSGVANVTRLSIGGVINLSKANGDNLDADYSYQWWIGIPGEPGSILLPETSSVITGLNAGTYFVKVISDITLCESIFKQIEISEESVVLPNAFIQLTQPQASCDPANGTAVLTAFGFEGQDRNNNGFVYLFTWEVEDANGARVPVVISGNTSITAGDNQSVLSNVNDGVYWVTVQNVSTGCSGEAFFIVADNSEEFRPQVSVSSQPRTNCGAPDGSVSAGIINPFTPPHNFRVRWFYHGLTENPAFNYTTATPISDQINGGLVLTGLTEGFYAVLITDLVTQCQSEPPVVIEVKDNRRPPVVTIVEQQPMTNCATEIANGQLFASADGGKVTGYTFQWFAGTTASGTPIAGANHLLIGQRAGIYTVRVTNQLTACFTDFSGEITDATVIAAAPSIEIEANRSNCIDPNGQASASVNGNTIDHFFDWYEGTSITGTPIFRGVTLRNADAITYSVIAIDKVTGCITAPATVTIPDDRNLPQFTFFSTPSHCEDFNGYVEITVTTPEAVDNVVWTNVDTGEEIGIGAFVNNVPPGFYRATVTTLEGCTNEGTVEVGTEITEYNGISANGDGINDLFQIDCISLFPDNNVKIYNRTGVLVFEMNFYNNQDRSFDGKGINGLYPIGKELPAGTYFYIIDKRNGSKPKTGFLELTR